MKHRNRVGFVGLVILAMGCIGCGTDHTSGTIINAEALESELAGDDWHWSYVTAALGGDRDTWLSCDGVGGVTETLRRWVVDDEGDSSYPVTTRGGHYTVDSAGRVQLTYPGVDGGERTETFTASVAADTPVFGYEEGVPTIKGRGRGMTTRAFVATGGDQWTTGFGWTEGAGTHQTDVTITLDMGAAVCVMTVRVVMLRRDAAGERAADETFTDVPCRFEQADVGLAAIADSLRTVEGRALSWMLLARRAVWKTA
ncbi:MAG: hypothetical protein ACI9WU_003605 [Myxococcota bacterium]